jgi:hypothetical protein
MAQLFVINGNSIVLNGETLFTANFINSFVVSPDLQSVYVASPYNIRKYVKNFNLTTGEMNWNSDDVKFNFKLGDSSQFISGLLLNGTFLYISTSNSQNKSNILKVNALSGMQYVSLDTGMNTSLIHDNMDASLTAMTIGDGKYLYATNTGNYNTGKSIDRIDLQDRSLNTRKWINNTVLAPIQCHIYESYLCVLEADIFYGKRLVEIFNLEDGKLVHTVKLQDSDYKSLGLSLAKSILRLIDSNSKILYTVDLKTIAINGTSNLPVV